MQIYVLINDMFAFMRYEPDRDASKFTMKRAKFISHERKQVINHLFLNWLTLALPFIILYIYSTLILVNLTDTSEVGSNI